jgi:uridylate kinase
MKTAVLSVGGSIIIPDRIDFKFIEELKKAIEKNYKKYKFVIVCGGGSIARRYIEALGAEKMPEKQLAIAGIRATRMNALFMMQLFGKEANETLPMDMKSVRDHLRKKNLAICGALRFAEHSTSDGTAAKLANYLKTDFINMTNINGLYTENPQNNPKAKFIPKISWKDFEKMALSIKFKAGQHFVLDQEAAVLIRKHKITTYIIGKSVRNLSSLLSGKKFEGTTISQ